MRVRDEIKEKTRRNKLATRLAKRTGSKTNGDRAKMVGKGEWRRKRRRRWFNYRPLPTIAGQHGPN